MIAGLHKHVTKSTILLNGKSYKKASVIARIERYLLALHEIDRMFAAWRIATTRATRLYFDDIHVLFADMKIVAAAVEKARATRKARGTMGKRQRKAIRGVVAPA